MIAIVGPNANLFLRVASSLVLVGIALAGWWLGGWVFAVSMAGLAVRVCFEWSRLSAPAAGRRMAMIVPAFAGLDVLCFHLDPPAAALALLAVAVLLLMAGTLDRGSVWFAAGLVYSCLPMAALVVLRDAPLGIEAVALVYAVVWTADSVAYFTGRWLGGPRLWPAVSPGKTWSGALGGVTAGALAGVVVGLVSGIGTLWWLALVAFGFAVVSVLGDLFESGIKRRFGAKDSGGIIPGHGGAMDRVDGMLAVAVVAVIIGWAAGGGLDNVAGGLLLWPR